MNPILWRPDAQRVAATTLSQFIRFLQRQYGEVSNDYEALHQWSVQNPELFWRGIWDYFEVQGQYNKERILDNADQMPGAQWFPSATLNFAENLLRHQSDKLALIERGEDGRRNTLTYPALRQQVAQLASALKQSGVGPGDRVAGFLPNCIASVVAMLATTSLGAVWSSCSPDFGIEGIMDRFGQIKPKVLFAVNGYHYGRKRISTSQKVAKIVEQLPELAQTVLVPYLEDEPTTVPGAVWWADYLDPTAVEPEFTAMPFNAPLYIMYSSGTTGAPKCIVHGIGGTLLQHLKELALHTDLNQTDTLFYYTTCGWMMWNWMVSGLALGATLVLYDGSPVHPRPENLFDLVDEEGITILGASAKYFSACEKAGLKPMQSHSLATLRSILSTGSPLAHESFDYIYRDIKGDLCLSSISGGTDILSCFALGNPSLPVYRGELQCIGLGMDVAFYDEDGQEVTDAKGELVCRTPFPSMPTGFWNDPDGEKYRSAYFAKFPNIWAHGDYGEIVTHSALADIPYQRGIIIHGRSDAVLNPGGVRIGTAEIYRQVEQIEEVLEAIAVGQDWQNDVRIILFVRMKPGITLDDGLRQRIRQQILNNTTPRHVPAKIIEVADIPRTISGKIVELAVRNVIHGLPVKNKDALANPEALDLYANIKEINE